MLHSCPPAVVPTSESAHRWGGSCSGLSLPVSLPENQDKHPSPVTSVSGVRRGSSPCPFDFHSSLIDGSGDLPLGAGGTALCRVKSLTHAVAVCGFLPSAVLFVPCRRGKFLFWLKIHSFQGMRLPTHERSAIISLDIL